MLTALVVDPSPMSRPLLSASLRQCSATWVDDGFAGLNVITEKFLANERFDFILIDTSIKQPSVARFIAELHKIEQQFLATQPMAIILMSGSGRLTLEADPLLPKVAGFLCRPFQARDFSRCLQRAGLAIPEQSRENTENSEASVDGTDGTEKSACDDENPRVHVRGGGSLVREDLRALKDTKLADTEKQVTTQIIRE